MHTIESPEGNILKVKVSGKLSQEEYAELVPSWEGMIERHGKMRLLFEMAPDFKGWEPMAALDDVKFSVSHRNDLERVAMVGANKWHEAAAKFGKLLVSAEVRFFENADEGMAWLKS